MTTTPKLLRKCRAQETGYNPPVGTTCSKQKPTDQRRVTTKTGPKGEKVVQQQPILVHHMRT
ncbi:hypothetical protein FA95DRAFT_971155 [Auriscalpium vulgare]|uniref:Uncharacterized protein n=1 Tax=Auriscalpium vulgare TaxID=40419 RepID=A0ACB8RXE2_9AGAM|nr:hypothetical protein FA95DRAFT_971155 [Auriscalpium vulgare]